MGENICKQYDQQRIDLPNIHTAQYQKKNQLKQKMGYLNRHLSKDIQMAETREKMLNIANYSVQFSLSVVSNSLRPHESQHARPPCPSPSLGVYPNSRPLSR